jgi:hypothetical protein
VKKAGNKRTTWFRPGDDATAQDDRAGLVQGKGNAMRAGIRPERSNCLAVKSERGHDCDHRDRPAGDHAADRLNQSIEVFLVKCIHIGTACEGT